MHPENLRDIENPELKKNSTRQYSTARGDGNGFWNSYAQISEYIAPIGIAMSASNNIL